MIILSFIFSLWSKTFSFQPNMYEEFHIRTHFEILMKTEHFYYAPIGKKNNFFIYIFYKLTLKKTQIADDHSLWASQGQQATRIGLRFGLQHRDSVMARVIKGCDEMPNRNDISKATTLGGQNSDSSRDTHSDRWPYRWMVVWPC